LARLAQIEAQTARFKAETRLLELRFVCECKKYGLKPEKLADGRQAFIVTNDDTDASENTGTVTDEEI
jgi:hypothetical protein